MEQMTEDEYVTVSAVNEMVATYFDNNSLFRFVKVKGEISNHAEWNGHHFFTIKDSASVLRCVIWKSAVPIALSFPLEEGKEVGLLGNLRFNTKKGEGQLIVARVVNLGEGGESLELKLLREKLKAEGVFDIEHKKPIPKYPKKVGIVTSKEGDAIRDICRVAHDRNPYVQLFLYNVTVQGASAPASIVEGIRAMDDRGYDLIIVSRGGGAREDLAPFDDEQVVRAVYEAKTPIVSGVGHERDWTLIDLAVDARFSTPTYAAQGVFPDVMSDIRRVRQLEDGIRRGMENALKRRLLLLESRRERLERFSPEAVLAKKTERLKAAREELDQAMTALVERRKHRLEVLIARMHGLSPTAKLVGGFGYITGPGGPVSTVDSVNPNDDIFIRVHDGEIKTKVLAVEKTSSGGTNGGEG